MLALLLLWFGISLPLVFLGYYFGYRKYVSIFFAFCFLKPNAPVHASDFSSKFRFYFLLWTDVIEWISYGCSNVRALIQRAFITIHLFASVKRRKWRQKLRHNSPVWAGLLSSIKHCVLCHKRILLKKKIYHPYISSRSPTNILYEPIKYLDRFPSNFGMFILYPGKIQLAFT